MIVLFVALKLLFHFWSNGVYGFHRDELATLDDARHLAWGYVAYPPLTPFLGRVELTLFGDTPRAFRVLAAIAQAIAILIASLMAKHLGGGRKAQWVAAFCVAIAPISLAASALFQYVTFDFLWWVLVCYFVVRLAQTDDPRWWTAIGAAIGLGVLTKYTIAFFVAGLVVGVLATDLRRHLASRWLWIGAAISIAIALPNLLWQATHDFVTLDFLRHIHERDVRIGRASDFFLDQVRLSTNPVTLPVWITGLIALIRSKRFRVLAWMCVIPFALFVIAKGRGYYTGPLYPILFAAGGVEIERVVRRRLTYVALAILFVIGCAVVPIVVPLAPPNSHLFKIASHINHDFR
ncbi:MAG TPA: glycosyltransferase family 39 protein, partial [Thermoanaerobaculia bacterium]